MDLQKFFNLLPSFVKEIDFNGIKIKHTGQFDETPYSRRYKVKVPIYTIENPNDQPYTKEALTTRLSEEYSKFQNFAGNLSVGSASFFVEFDDNVLDLYIPKDIKQEITNCLKGKDFDRVAWRNPENFRVIGEFKEYNRFDSEDDRIMWRVDFKVHKIEIVDETGEFIKEVGEDVYDFVFEILEEDLDFFEYKIWSCVNQRLANQETFIDFNYMSWYTQVDRVNY